MLYYIKLYKTLSGIILHKTFMKLKFILFVDKYRNYFIRTTLYFTNRELSSVYCNIAIQFLPSSCFRTIHTRKTAHVVKESCYY